MFYRNGRTRAGRPIFVAFTIRQKAACVSLRPVSARYMHAKRASDMKKREVPKLTTDAEAEAFLEQDLSDLDFSQFKKVHFEFEKKDAQLNMRIPRPLLDAVKKQARTRGVPYTRLIREAIELAIASPKR